MYVCPNCRNAIAATRDGRCPECGQALAMTASAVPSPQQPAIQTMPDAEYQARRDLVNFFAILMHRTPRVWVTPLIVGTNALIFVALTVATGEPMRPPLQTMIDWGANFGPRTLNGEPWRIFTAMFLHFGLLHVGFNMWVLWELGRLVERCVGNVGFLLLYLISGLAGSLGSLAWHADVVSAGASGAVFGVCGALLGFLLRRRDTIPLGVIKSLRGSLLTFLLYNVVFSSLVPGIDMAAHGGGLAAGFCCGLIMSQPLDLHSVAHRWRRNLVTALLAIVALPLSFTLLPAAPQDIAVAQQQFDRLRQEAIARYNAAAQDMKADKISEGELADIVEQSVLPTWRKAHLQLQQLRESPMVRQEVADSLDRYMTLLEESWQALVQAIRQNDPDKMAEHQRKWKQAEGFVEGL
jgi:rhomboid protease GluP